MLSLEEWNTLIFPALMKYVLPIEQKNPIYIYKSYISVQKKKKKNNNKTKQKKQQKHKA